MRCIVMPNTYLLGSPWEADALTVTPAGYWHEYEIKVSMSDYRADFRKQLYGGNNCEVTKHELYASDSAIERPYRKPTPKPKSFTFVVPDGMLEGVEVPDYCRVIEYVKGYGNWSMRHMKGGRELKKPTKLNDAQIFNLAVKATQRLAGYIMKERDV
jgi:hypothetical protein